jgi:hypothetical protein
MAFSHSSYIDARGGNFANIGRDQHVHWHTVNITISGSNPEQTVPDLLRNLNVSQWPTSSTSSGNLSRRECITRRCRSGTGTAGDVVAILLVKIVHLLIDHGEPSHYHLGLKLQLESLHKILILTDLALQTYEYTPLGRNLANTIIPEVEQIGVALQELFDRINGYRQGLHPTSIRNLWRQVWWSGCEEDGLVSLTMKLSSHQKSLGKFLMALDS